jgi:hypothetical protein
MNFHTNVLKNIVCIAKLFTFFCNSIAKPAVTGAHKYILRVPNTQNSRFADLWFKVSILTRSIKKNLFDEKMRLLRSFLEKAFEKKLLRVANSCKKSMHSKKISKATKNG